MSVFLSNIIGHTMGIVTIYYLYENFLQSNMKFDRKSKFLIYFATVLFGIFYSTVTMNKLLRFLGMTIDLLIPYVLYKNKFGFKLILSAVWATLTVLSELLVKALLLGHTGNLSIYYTNYEYNYLLGTVFSRILTCLLVVVYVFCVKMREQKLPVYMYLLICLVPFSSTVIFYQLQEIVAQIDDAEVYTTYCIITFVLLLFNLIFIYLFSQATQTSWLKARLAYEESRTQDQHRYHQNLAVYHQKVRQLSHDLHNHLLILHHALQEKDYSTAEQYVEKQLTILDGSKTIYTGYLLLDTILDYKQQIARNKQIRMQIQSALEPDMPLTEELLQDWCIMLSSCLDNAIEAAEQIAEVEQRKIKVSIKYDAFYLSCCVENNVQAPVPLVEQQIPQTAKSDKTLHGLGLQNVKRLAEQHDGYLVLECSETVFTTRFTAKYR